MTDAGSELQLRITSSILDITNNSPEELRVSQIPSFGRHTVIRMGKITAVMLFNCRCR
jgi:hypothetical protein